MNIPPLSDYDDKLIQQMADELLGAGRVNFAEGGLTPPINVTAPIPTDAEREEYFRTHDAEGNLKIPNEFAPPQVPQWGAKDVEVAAKKYDIVDAYRELGVAPLEMMASIATGATAIPYMMYRTGDWGRKTMQEQVGANRDIDDYMSKYTYHPRTSLARQGLESMGRALDTAKIPPIIPELFGLQGMRHVVPTDIQAMHGKARKTTDDLRNLKTDYINAQSGIYRGDLPTIGAKLQRLAYAAADRSARAKARKYPGGWNTTLPDAGRLYAVFPEGAPKRMLQQGKFDDEGVKINGKFYEYARLVDKYGVDRPVAEKAFTDFRFKKIKQLYPDANVPTALILMSKFRRRSPEQVEALETAWVEEFLNTNDVGLPPVQEILAREDKAARVSQQSWPNYIASTLGQANKNQLVDLAEQGHTLVDPETLKTSSKFFLKNPALAESLVRDRVAAGLPAEGLAQQKMNILEESVAQIDAQLDGHRQTMNAMETQWVDRNQPPPDGYLAVRRAMSKLGDNKAAIQKQLKLMEFAPATEALSDLAMSDWKHPSEHRKTIAESMLQFYPYLDYKKDPDTGAYLLREDKHGRLVPELVTPESERIYLPSTQYTDALGLNKLRYKYIEDIRTNKTQKQIQQYVDQQARELTKQRELAAHIETNRERLTTENYLSYTNNVPEDKVFDNYAAVEFGPWMSEEELGKGLSIDTDVLQHCVARGRRSGNKYVGLYDPATGRLRDGSEGKTSPEINEIVKEGTVVTSIRDRQTGKPVATIKLVPAVLHPSGKRGYLLDTVSGYENGVVNPVATQALSDYLNSIKDKIVGKKTNYLYINAAILDTTEDYQRSRAAQLSGVSPETLPRFVTEGKLKAMRSAGGDDVTMPTDKDIKDYISTMSDEEIERLRAQGPLEGEVARFLRDDPATLETLRRAFRVNFADGGLTGFDRSDVSKDFADGCAVYDTARIDQLANELLGATHG